MNAEQVETLALGLAALRPGWEQVKDCTPEQIGWGAREGYLLAARADAASLAPLVMAWLQQDDAERAAVAAMPEGERPHYELNDGTCVTCGEPWMCQTAAT